MTPNRNRLFLASCVALITTAMTFAIRANVMTKLGTDFGMTSAEIGICAGTAFWGFTLAMVFGGFLVDTLGMRFLLTIAFVGHLAGVGLTLAASGFWSLFISTLLVGIANGMVEAACNPLVASLYPDNKTTMLNRFHVWFPGGIVIGGLVAYVLEQSGMGWQVQTATILLPALTYGFLFMNQTFIQTERVTSGLTMGQMLQACTKPLFLLMVFCMLFTAATELGTTQWIDSLLKGQIDNPIIVLVVITGIMAMGRAFAGPFVHSLSPSGMLLGSAVLSTIGLMLLGHGYTWVGAIVFAMGVCYFWPTMLGFVSEYVPASGALGLSIMGGAGMLSVSIVLPLMGGLYDAQKADAIDTLKKTMPTADFSHIQQLAGDMAGMGTLSMVAYMPLVLALVFAALYFGRKATT